MDAQYLHNAGNDAAYTLQSLILMAIKEFHQPDSVSKAIEEQRAITLANRKPPRKRKKTDQQEEKVDQTAVVKVE